MKLFIGGLGAQTTERHLTDQLSKYGRVGRVHVPDAVIGGHRGFAFVDLDFASEDHQKRCFSALSGSVWMGGRVKIEAAKKEEYKWQPEQEEREPRTRALVRHADGHQGLVTEKSLDHKRRDWWYRGKYGRPVAVMKMRRPNGVLCTIDPAHHKDRFEKLFGTEKPKPFSKLCWAYDEGRHEESKSASDQVQVLEEDADHPTRPHSPPQAEHKAPPPPSPTHRLSALICDLDSIPSLGIFFRDRPFEELRLEWLNRRSELQQDFKRRAKQAKRMQRKRLALQ